MEKNKKIIGLVFLAVVLVLVVYAVRHNNSSSKMIENRPTSTLKTYSLKNPPVSIVYPSFFNVLEQNNQTSTTSTSVVFSAGKNEILFTVSRKSSSDVQKDKASIEKKLTKDPRGALSTERIKIGDFSGFKFLVAFEKSRYIVFKDQGETTLVVDSEISAPSDKELPDLEAKLLAMITSIH